VIFCDALIAKRKPSGVAAFHASIVFAFGMR
jgi:hypothetical protein